MCFFEIVCAALGNPLAGFQIDRVPMQQCLLSIAAPENKNVRVNESARAIYTFVNATVERKNAQPLHPIIS
jgi:hypothetical protein